MRTDFDYIIVGAGSAGSVLAARLTEDPDVTVALVEAGGRDEALEINVPLLFPQLFKTQFDWDFASEPEAATPLPAQGKAQVQKAYINQCGLADVSLFVSRSARAITCCAKSSMRRMTDTMTKILQPR
jgi:choline dehydrogenase-like flavoprotein